MYFTKKCAFENQGCFAIMIYPTNFGITLRKYFIKYLIRKYLTVVFLKFTDASLKIADDFCWNFVG
jgi:hypothetical protein